MKLPNVASLVVVLLAVMPALIAAVEQQFPQAEYWWAAMAVTGLGALGKWLQEKYGKPAPPPAMPKGAAASPNFVSAKAPPSRAARILWG